MKRPIAEICNTSLRVKRTLLSKPSVKFAKLQQSVLKIYKVEQTTIDDDIDFSDNRLLGAIYFTKNDDTKYPIVQSTIFDNEVFNQDIYITHTYFSV